MPTRSPRCAVRSADSSSGKPPPWSSRASAWRASASSYAVASAPRPSSVPRGYQPDADTLLPPHGPHTDGPRRTTMASATDLVRALAHGGRLEMLAHLNPKVWEVIGGGP